MRNGKIYLYGLIVLVLWLFFVLAPYGFKLFPVEYEDLSIAYVSATALFTALAFGVSLYILFRQRSDVVTKTKLDFFVNILDKVKNDPLFVQARNYILSDVFNRDCKALEKTSISRKISIGDFKKLKNKKSLSISPYECVRYFCDKMDFIGIIVKEKYLDTADTALFDYYGKVIINSYKTLEPLLLNSREKEETDVFYHFTYLYNAASNRKLDIESKEIDRLLNLFEKDEKKRKEKIEKIKKKELKKSKWRFRLNKITTVITRSET